MSKRVNVEMIIAGIVGGLGDAEIARRAECSERSVRRHKTNPEVVAAVREARSARLRQASDQAGTLLVAVQRRVAAILNQQNPDDRTIIAAYRAILKAASDLHDRTELDQRITALEVAAGMAGSNVVQFPQAHAAVAYRVDGR